jgi:ectoine hydroxylase-related dioxygenase (phytanoyl-CoA dioxygenase family)
MSKKQVMSFIKYWLRSAIYVFQLLLGLFCYFLTKRTSQKAHLAMVMLFCRTRGRSSDALSWIISQVRSPRSIEPTNGLLPTGTQVEAVSAVQALRERGYYVFQNKLPEELCNKLLAFATQHPASTRIMDGEVGVMESMVYDRQHPRAVRYDFSTQDLLNNEDVQKILADLSFASIAQEYLRAIPIVDVVSMWWHTNFSDKPDGESAQFFHFDMDRPKWLKFFIYLTDVTAENGPHSYVAGSHKTNGIPAELLNKGYARLKDEEIKTYYSASDIIEFIAPRGTILAEDTRGLHKGKHVISGDRLMFQIQFSNSLFGASYPSARIAEKIIKELRVSIERYPEVYSAYSNISRNVW